MAQGILLAVFTMFFCEVFLFLRGSVLASVFFLSAAMSHCVITISVVRRPANGTINYIVIIKEIAIANRTLAI